jgi:hypothetical protein
MGFRYATGRLGYKKAAGGGWWLSGGISAANCIAAYQPKGAASYAASLTDLSGTGNDATEGTAPDWSSADGWDFDSANTEYLDTGITILKTYTMIIKFTESPDAVQVVCGSYENSGANVHRIIPNRNNGSYYYGNTSIPGDIVAGVMAIAGDDGYLDGSLDRENVDVDDSESTYYIGAQHQGASAAAPYGGKVQAFAAYNTVLSADQISALTTAMNAL